MRTRLSAPTTCSHATLGSRALVTGLLSLSVLLAAGAAGATAATATPTRASRPDLVVSVVSLSTAHATTGHTLTVTDTTKNTGTGQAGTSTTSYYLSKDKSRSRSDKLLGSRTIVKLRGGAKSTGKKTVMVPSGTTAGSYYMLACADAKNAVRETNEKNNCRSSTALTVVRPTPPPPPPSGSGPDQTARDLLLSQAGPMKLFSSPPPTSDLTATSTFEDARAVTKSIGPAGGNIAVTDDAGDQITISFPANALLAPVDITATPVAATQGTDAVNAHPIGLKLEPSGLGLMQEATMTVVPASGSADEKVEGFTAASNGTDVNPAMVLPDTATLSMPVDHFTIVTALVPNGDGTTTTQYFTQTEYTQTLHNALIQAIQDARNTAVDNHTLVDINAVITSAEDQYWNTVALPLLQQSETSCTFARANMSTVEQAVHESAILGIDRPEFTPGLEVVLQNCWKEATATCMVMSPDRYSEVVALARQMDVLGVLTEGGQTPDPLDLNWCGDANGFITINYTHDFNDTTSQNNTSQKEVDKAVVWVSGSSYRWWNADGTFSVFVNGANPTNSSTDLSASYTDQYQDLTPGFECSHDLSTQATLQRAPTNVSVAQRAYSTSTWQATDATQGLSITGGQIEIPAPSGTLAGTDDCNDGFLGSTYGFDSWWVPTINQQYRLAVDAIKGDLTTHWDNTVENGYGSTDHYVIDADIHVDGLKEFIAAGH